MYPMNIKLFTMVKDEVDIIKEWILYHGYLFGYTNLFIVDNFSTDGTFECIQEFKQLGVNIFREEDYIQKGNIMTKLIREYCSNGIAYPIDIDEFIVLYDKPNNTISADKDTILHYFSSLPVRPVYKTNYIISKITNDGYKNAVEESVCGTYSDYGHFAKSFFHTSLFNDSIDHGNHYCTEEYFFTDLVLLHYHHRSLDQMKKKIYNNVQGLGYDIHNMEELKRLEINGCSGHHHVKNIIQLLENRYALPTHTHNVEDCLLKPFSDLMLTLKSPMEAKQNLPNSPHDVLIN